MRFPLVLLLLSSVLFAETGRFVTSADKEAESFETHKPKMRVDVFDFEGAYPNLKNIKLDAKRKKNVEFYLTGEYPVLESIHYDGSFGALKGELTGDFPHLNNINFLCGSCAMQLDLTGHWQENCIINIRGAKENIELTLPENIGLIINTKTSVKGKVIAATSLKKKKRFSWLQKTYSNELAETAPLTLTINVEVTDAQIILN